MEIFSYSRVITESKWTHVALLLKNPTYINPNYTDGVYVLESGSESWTRKIGVIVSPIDKVLKAKQSSRIVYRKLIRDKPIEDRDMEIYKYLFRQEEEGFIP
jgi:hypothetical protein